MSWETLNTDINTLMNTISAVNVYDAPRTDFAGYPTITITPININQSLQSVDENVRTYSFDINVFYDASSIDIKTAEDRIDDLIETVHNKFATEEKLDTTRTVGSSLPSGSTIISIDPAVGEFRYIPKNKLLVKNVTVDIRVIKDITSGLTSSTIDEGTYIGLGVGITYAESIDL